MRQTTEQSQDFPSLWVKLDFSLNAWNLILFHLKMHMLGKIIINILKVFSWSKTYAVQNFIFFITDSCILFCGRYTLCGLLFSRSTHQSICMDFKKIVGWCFHCPETTDFSRPDGSTYSKVLMQHRCRGYWCSEGWQKVLTKSQETPQWL